MMMDCPDMALPMHVMQHVMRVESGFNPYAIGVVGGRLARQPRNLPEAVATARMLEQGGFNFSLGLAQVNRYNLARYGLGSYEKAFSACDNVRAGSRILRECYQRAGDWGKALSCYYSGNFVTGFRHGYVQKVMATMGPSLQVAQAGAVQPIPVYRRGSRTPSASRPPSPARAARTPSPTVGAEVPTLVRPGVPAAVPAQPAATAIPLPTPQLPGDSSFVF